VDVWVLEEEVVSCKPVNGRGGGLEHYSRQRVSLERHVDHFPVGQTRKSLAGGKFVVRALQDARVQGSKQHCRLR
jgi:hypothetical protein